MSDHHITESKCPKCGHKFDAAMNAEPGVDNKPKPGDYTVCIECAEVLVFAEDLTVRLTTEDERIEIEADPELRDGLATAQAAVRSIHKVN